MPNLTKKAIRYRRTDGRTKPNYRKASLLKNVCKALFTSMITSIMRAVKILSEYATLFEMTVMHCFFYRDIGIV